MLNTSEVAALGQIFNHTFGYSSDSIKVTSSLHGDSLVLKYITVLQFGSESSMQEHMKGHEKEATKVVDDALSRMKKEFRETTGRSIKCTEESRDSDVELISANANTPRKLAYYRMTVHLKVS